MISTPHHQIDLAGLKEPDIVYLFYAASSGILKNYYLFFIEKVIQLSLLVFVQAAEVNLRRYIPREYIKYCIINHPNCSDWRICSLVLLGKKAAKETGRSTITDAGICPDGFHSGY